jgi:hypothetical protein
MKKIIYISIISVIIITLSFCGYFLLKDTPHLRKPKTYLKCEGLQIKITSHYLRDKMNKTILQYCIVNGINPVKNKQEITSNKKLEKVIPKKFLIQKLTHSYPYLKPETYILLTEICQAFQAKLKGTSLEQTVPIVTSLTRTIESNKLLQKVNQNAQKRSTHLYGMALDLAYSNFHHPKMKLRSCHNKYLKEVLASVLSDFRKQKRCWAVYETREKCFHIVSR